MGAPNMRCASRPSWSCDHHMHEAPEVFVHRYGPRFPILSFVPGFPYPLSLSRSVQEDLWGEGEHDSPRFTLLVVDVSSEGRASTVPCAVVLIPRGRDRDFTFSSREGLHQVRHSAGPLPS